MRSSPLHHTCRDRSLDFSSTLTTEAFDLSRLRRFGANSYQPTPMDLPSSPVEHGHFMDEAPFVSHISRFIRLVSPLKAAAFHHIVQFLQASLLTERDADDPRPSLHGNYSASSLLRRGPPLQSASIFPPDESSSLCAFSLSIALQLPKFRNESPG